MSALRTIAGLFTDRWRSPARCAACGNDFTCGAKLTGCWCGELKLSDAARAELRSKFTGCVCRDCLEAVAHKHDLGRVPH